MGGLRRSGEDGRAGGLRVDALAARSGRREPSRLLASGRRGTPRPWFVCFLSDCHTVSLNASGGGPAAGAELATSANASQESWEILSSEGSPGSPSARKASTPSPSWDTLSSSPSPELGVVPVDERVSSTDVKRNLFYQGYGETFTTVTLFAACPF